MNPFDTAKDMIRNLVSLGETNLSAYTCFSIAVSICILFSSFMTWKYFHKDKPDFDKADFWFQISWELTILWFVVTVFSKYK